MDLMSLSSSNQPYVKAPMKTQSNDPNLILSSPITGLVKEQAMLPLCHNRRLSYNILDHFHV